MKKQWKLLSIALAAVVWLSLSGALFVYVVDDNGLFGSTTSRGDLPVTDESLKDTIESLLDGTESEASQGGAQSENSGGSGGSSGGSSGGGTPSGGTQATGGVADRLVIGDKASESGHGLALSGSVKKTAVKTATGTLTDSYTALRFAGRGATAAFTLNLSGPAPKNGAEPVLLEITEIHEATAQAFGYTVYVDGKAVYFRTYEQIASAPNHYFVAVDRRAIRNLSQVEVKLVSESSKPFHVADVQAYVNFYELMEKEGVYQKLGIHFYSASNPDNAVSTIRKWPNNYSMFDTGMMLSLKYMNNNETEAAAALESYIEAAEAADSRLQIMSAMYWSNSPYSPDGLGGSFSDLKYSQVLYNSALKLYSATTPNVYSSTQWVTSGSAVLNKAAVTKITDFFSAFADSLSFLRARGKSTQPLDLVMEWGVCYKGFGTVTGYSDYGSMDGADFHPSLVAAAKKEGVALDPTDGLSKAEKVWLTSWHARYNQMLANAYRSAMGTDAVQVSGGKVTLPETQTADHIFSHNVQWINQNPSWGDLTVSGWQSGVGDGFYSSSEDMFFDPVRFYQYKAAYGRTGCVNLEMAIHNPKGVIQRYVRRSYQNGLEFVTLFNDKAEYHTADNLREIDRQENSAAAAPEHFDVHLLDVDVQRDAATNPVKNPAAGVTYQNLTLKDGKLVLTDAAKPGVITVKLGDGEAFDNGLYMDVYSIMGKGKLEVAAGDSLGSLTALGAGELMLNNDRFNQNNTTRYDFGAKAKGKSTYYVRITVTANGSNPSVRGFKIYRPFAQTAGQLNGVTTTLKQARLQSLWVSQQAVTRNQYAHYVQKNGGKDSVTKLAEELMDGGYYKTAYRLLAGEVSQVLPAKYLVTGSGTLGKYPIALTLSKASDCVQITLTKVGADECGFSFVTEKNQNVTMTFTGLKNGRHYALSDKGNNTFVLKADNGGSVAPSGGKATVTVKVKTAKKPQYTTVSGRAYNNGGGSTLKVTVQDPAIGQYAQYVEFMVSSECVYTRRADGSTQTANGMPRIGDYVTLTFNSNNMVVKCEAVYGDKTGEIRSFTPPSVAAGGTNGVIEFTDGTRFELENQATTTSIRLTGTDVRARTKTPAQLAAIFKPGATIRITYCPERINGSLPRVITVTNP